MKLSIPVVLGSLLLLSACNETTAATMRPASTTQTNPQLQLLSRVNSLETEVSSLQNTVDLQENEINRLRERVSGVYDDLDRRMQLIEQASTSLSPQYSGRSGMMQDTDIPSIPSTRSDDTSMNAVIAPNDMAMDSSTAEVQRSVSSLDTTATSTQSNESTAESNEAPEVEKVDSSELEQAAYDRAFDYLKQSRYEEAVSSFKEFQVQFPESDLADSAQYWVAEARYVNRSYEGALHEYKSLIQLYPTSKRLPDAMLKSVISTLKMNNGIRLEAH
jgi:tol-pal system protein YbgF